MISQRGHIKLIDFGFSKLIGTTGWTSTPCGTADYLAPEVVHKMPYGLEVDLWTYGVLLCEMIGGFTPFHDSDEETMFRKIVHLDMTWPKNIDWVAKDLISKILVTDPIMRISIKDIKQHPFFESIDWGKAERLELDPPFIPDQLEPIDTYFPYAKPATREDLTNGFMTSTGVKPLGQYWPFANSSKLRDF